MDKAIVADNITKRFGNFTAVSNLNLTVPKACIYGFLGPNGCGKSTTIRMLTGLLTPSEGSVSVLSYSLPKEAELLKRKIGYMTQKFSLYNDLTVKENLSFIAKIYDFKHSDEKRRIEELMSCYSLEPLAHQITNGLSGGQKQRLALAAATFHKPDLLFLDEPTSAVDPENRREFWENLFDLVEQNTTILVSTHYMDEAERCHYLAILDSGKLMANDEPRKLIEQMHANTVEISGDNLRSLKQQLLSVPHVISAAQHGIRLRVLIEDSIDNPIAWLKQQVPLQNKLIETVRPGLEDVFIRFTN